LENFNKIFLLTKVTWLVILLVTEETLADLMGRLSEANSTNHPEL
jgi:hypothetical protein